MENIQIQHYQSPVGELLLGSFAEQLCLCDWANGRRHERTTRRLQNSLQSTFGTTSSEVIKRAISQLDEYFVRRRVSFNIPLLFVGTDFQKTVWNRLLEIPYGTTISYGEMAIQMGAPTSVRAIANAIGDNPLSIFAPCHRIIGRNHTLTGYNGGIEVKRLLIELETMRGTIFPSLSDVPV